LRTEELWAPGGITTWNTVLIFGSDVVGIHPLRYRKGPLEGTVGALQADEVVAVLKVLAAALSPDGQQAVVGGDVDVLYRIDLGEVNAKDEIFVPSRRRRQASNWLPAPRPKSPLGHQRAGPARRACRTN
jgi:hypothetical protein